VPLHPQAFEVELQDWGEQEFQDSEIPQGGNEEFSTGDLFNARNQEGEPFAAVMNRHKVRHRIIDLKFY